jgi:predicted transcriptional regulator
MIKSSIRHAMVDSVSKADKRGAFDICADILLVLERESACSRAIIALKSNLDSRAMSKYLQILQRFELVLTMSANEQTKIMISEKGKKYLHQYTRLVALLD